MNSPTDRNEREIFTPSRLNREVRVQLEMAFRHIWIEGEISNLAQPASGHAYFSLKDRGAQVRCALFRQHRMRSPVRLEEGLQVLLRGRVSLYEPRGDFQILAEHVEEAGRGQLQREFEQLKARLAAEGLFAEAKKRPLPAFPQRIAVITSASGAALRDVLSVLERRYPAVRVLLCPSTVQGEAAAGELRRALDRAIRAAPDVILLTRGGGSIEDLWPFNDEALARAIAASPIPVLSAVGHEIDFTIADFAADLRAPTPSAAAELLVPDGGDLLQRLDGLERNLRRLLGQRLSMSEAQIDYLRRHLGAQHPGTRLERARERLQLARRHLRSVAEHRLDRQGHRLAVLRTRLGAQDPSQRLRHFRQDLERLQRALPGTLLRSMTRRREQLARLVRNLHAVSPLAVLQRGYSVTRDAESGAVVASVSQLEVGDRLRTRLTDGELESRVTRLLPAAEASEGPGQ